VVSGVSRYGLERAARNLPTKAQTSLFYAARRGKSSSTLWRSRLSAAVKDQYQRTSSKRGRYRPHFKDVPSAGKPKIIRATATQRKLYQALTTAA
jgi:hypothetical protein